MEEKNWSPEKWKQMLKGIYSTIDSGLLSRRTCEMLETWWWESLTAWLIIELLTWDLSLTNSCPCFFQTPDLGNSPNSYTSDFVSQKPSWFGLLCIILKLNWAWWYKTIILPLREWNRRIRSLRSVWATKCVPGLPRPQRKSCFQTPINQPTPESYMPTSQKSDFTFRFAELTFLTKLKNG